MVIHARGVASYREGCGHTWEGCVLRSIVHENRVSFVYTAVTDVMVCTREQSICR